MSFHPGNLRTCCAALVAALLVLPAGCSDDSPGTTAYVGTPATLGASTEPDPLAGAPSLDVCFAMTRSAAAAVTNEGPVVDCAEPHTSMTYHVGRFAAGDQISDDDYASDTCEHFLSTGVGLSPTEVRSSILTWIWFEPTTAQWSAGARWFRCDVIAQQDNGLFKDLPQSTPLFPDGVPDPYFRCMRERGKDGIPVTCDKAHDYRWAGTFEGRGKRLPSRARLLDQADEHCYDITGTRTWWVTWPNKDRWAAGDRHMACYKRTRS